MRVSGAMTMRLGRSTPPMRTGVKRGWGDMAGSWRGSDRDDDLADLFARLDEAMGVCDLVEGEGAGDRRTQRPFGEAAANEALQRCKLGVVPHETGKGEAANGEVARENVEGRHHRWLGRERAIKDQSAAICSRPCKLRECGATDRIEDQIGSPRV